MPLASGAEPRTFVNLRTEGLSRAAPVVTGVAPITKDHTLLLGAGSAAGARSIILGLARGRKDRHYLRRLTPQGVAQGLRLHGAGGKARIPLWRRYLGYPV